MDRKPVDELRPKLRELIKKHSKDTIKNESDSFFFKYAISFYGAKGPYEPEIKNEEYFKDVKNVLFWFDADFSLLLEFDGVPIACISFYKQNFIHHNTNNTILNCCAIQIQGAKFRMHSGITDNNNFKLADFDWQKVLIEIFEIFQVEYLMPQDDADISISYVLPSDLNDWGEVRANSDEDERGYKSYDRTALDLGYQVLLEHKISKKEPLYDFLIYVMGEFQGRYYKVLHPILYHEITATNTLQQSTGIERVLPLAIENDINMINSPILDIGAGYGRDSLFIKKQWKNLGKVYLVDRDKLALNGARKNFIGERFQEGFDFEIIESEIKDFRKHKLKNSIYTEGIGDSRIVILSNIIPYLKRRYMDKLFNEVLGSSILQESIFYVNFFTKNEVKNYALHGDKIREIYSAKNIWSNSKKNLIGHLKKIRLVKILEYKTYNVKFAQSGKTVINGGCYVIFTLDKGSKKGYRT